MIEKDIIIDDLNIHFYQSDILNPVGAVIFLHGWGSEALHLKGIFEKCNNFVAIDLPGFGKSERSTAAWATNEYAELLDKFLIKLNIAQPVLVGHSFGGSIIIKYCASHLEAKKIILIGSAGIRRKSSKLFLYRLGAAVFNVVFFLPILRHLKNTLRKNFYKFIGSEDYLNVGEMKEIFQKVINDDLTDDMREIRTEAVLIWGKDDIETPISDAKVMKELIGNSELFVIPRAGHFVFLDNKIEFDKIFFAQFS